MADDMCSGFAPQTWSTERCKKCFRRREQHGTEFRKDGTYKSSYENLSTARDASTSNGATTAATTYSWRRKVYTSSNTGDGASADVGKVETTTTKPATTTSPTVGSKNSKRSDTSSTTASAKHPRMESASDAASDSSRRSQSPVDVSERSFGSAISAAGTDQPAPGALSKTASFESLYSSVETRSMVTAVSGSDRSSTPTENLNEDTHAFMRSIKAQLEIMEQKCATLERENAKLKGTTEPYVMNGYDRDAEDDAGAQTSGSSNTDTVIRQLHDKMAANESLCQDYRDENTVLKCELRELQEATSKHSSHEIKDLKDKLAAAESLCEELMDENDGMKKEVQDLQTEIEELQDQYREEEIEEFRELQKELEQTAKNCRILQFKLRKAERKSDQTEADRIHLQEKVKELLMTSAVGDQVTDNPRLRELESELRIAKEVSVRLHNELENLEEKRCKLEDENFYLKEKVREIETREKIEHNRYKHDMKKGAVQVATPPPLRKSDPVQNLSKVVGSDKADDVMTSSQTMRDLKDAMEREMDLKDQLRFAEEDLQTAHRKLGDLETENEGLLKQLQKFTHGSTTRSSRAPMIRSYSEGHAQIELELAEHEATTLKERLVRAEKENEKMASQISLLELEVRRHGGRAEFEPDEIRSAAPDIYYKQKIKLLEEEVDDLKFKLEGQKAEADQDFSSLKRSSRVNRSRSLEADQQEPHHLDHKRQVALMEQETNVLRQRISDMEAEHERLSEENKKLAFRKRVGKTASDGGSDSDLKLQERVDQMEKDIHRFIQRISVLEKERESMIKELQAKSKTAGSPKLIDKSLVSPDAKFDPKTATTSELREKCAELLLASVNQQTSLKSEQQKAAELEAQLNEYKVVIAQSENQKLVAMATKVEILSNQLKTSQERYESFHKRFVSGGGADKERKYEDALKERIEALEKELAVEKSKHIMSTAGGVSPKTTVKSAKSDENKEVLAKELRHCHEMLAAAEGQVERLYKHLEEIENAQKLQAQQTPAKSVSASTTSRTKAAEPAQSSSAEKERLLKEMNKVKGEVDQLRQQLQKTVKKSDQNTEKTAAVKPSVAAAASSAQRNKECTEHEKTITDLKRQLELASKDKQAAKQECVTATERLLQTEERWNKELEKLKESYENQVKDLKFHLQEAERDREEKQQLFKDRSSTLADKTKRLTDLEAKLARTEAELKNRPKDLQTQLEAEKKKSMEFQTKYQKLEELYEADRQKLSIEREKFKADLMEMKKKNDDTMSDVEKLKQVMDRKQSMWSKEKHELEAKVKSLQVEISDVEKRAAKRAAETASAENKKLLAEIAAQKRKEEADIEQHKLEKNLLNDKLEQKSRDLEFRLDELERMRKEMNTLKSRIEEQKHQLEETRRSRDDTKEELNRWQQTWTRERSELTHKLRQEEKVQQAEQQALHLKYESRIRVMEDSSKRLQGELTRTRRERDQQRESMVTAERKLAESTQKFENDEKTWRTQLDAHRSQGDEYADIKLQLEHYKTEVKNLQKTAEHDNALWKVEREKFEKRIQDLLVASGSATPVRPPRKASASGLDNPEKSLNETMQICKELRQQIDDMRKRNENEAQQQRQQSDKTRQELQKERQELMKRIRDLQENVKILDIDRRNMLSTKDAQEQERSQLQSEKDSLTDKLHDTEIHQLANKYKLDKVADQLSDVQNKVKFTPDISPNERKELQDSIRKALEQLVTVREDMGRTKELNKALDIPEKDDTSNTGTSGSVFRPYTRRAITSLQTMQKEVAQDLEASAAATDLTPSPSKGPEKSRSLSTDTGFEARIAELRLRSPSPSPRKVTNYPEAPPSFLLNTKMNTVEYDEQGRMHWTRRSVVMNRAASMDPTPVSNGFDDGPQDGSGSPKSHSRSASTGTAKVYGLESSEASLAATDAQTQSLARSPKKPRGRVAAMAEKFTKSSASASTTVVKSSTQAAPTAESPAKDKRSLFGSKGKSRSIEVTETGHTIGAIGVQVLSPGASPAALPESLHASQGLDSPYKLRKSYSATKLFEKLIPKRSLSRQSSGEGSVGGPSGEAGRSTSEENVIIPIKKLH